jgi:hypothetical protein
MVGVVRLAGGSIGGGKRRAPNLLFERERGISDKNKNWNFLLKNGVKNAAWKKQCPFLFPQRSTGLQPSA